MLDSQMFILDDEIKIIREQNFGIIAKNTF